MADTKDAEAREIGYNPVEVVSKQWPLVHKAVASLLSLSGGDSATLRETLKARAQAGDLSGLQTELKKRLDGDNDAINRAGGKNNEFDSALLAVVVNLSIVGEASITLARDLPRNVLQMGNRIHIEMFPELLVEGLTKMDRDARVLGVGSYDNPISK